MSLIESTTYEEAVIAVRKKLIEISGLDGTLVLNSDSLRGPQVFKYISSKIAEAPRRQNSFIIFEVTENQDRLYGASKQDDTTMEIITPYTIHLKIYGEDSHNLSKKIFGKLKNDLVAEDLRDSGVYIDGVSSITSVNEFINNTLWIRCDLEFYIICRSEITVASASDAEYFGSTIIIKV